MRPTEPNRRPDTSPLVVRVSAPERPTSPPSRTATTAVTAEAREHPAEQRDDRLPVDGDAGDQREPERQIRNLGQVNLPGRRPRRVTSPNEKPQRQWNEHEQ